MTDRFSAQLRHHLLATSDERPAEGQLAAVLAGVAATKQRRSIVAGLTLTPGRIGPFPSVALRYALVAAALVGTLLAAALLGAGLLTPRTVFEGTWSMIDPGDGSTQFLIVGAGPEPSVVFVDELASGGACRNDAVKEFRADGTGTISGDHLDAVYPNGGGCGLDRVPVAGQYDYDRVTDSLRDQDGVVWTRVTGGAGPSLVPASVGPTVAPTVGPTAQDSACIDLSSGGVYGVRLGSLFVTLEVPRGPSTAWAGEKGVFDLSSSCASANPIDIRATLVTTVYADACHPDGSSVAVTSQAEAVAQFAAQRGHDTTGPDVTALNGHPAAEFTISASDACTPFVLWNGIDADDHGAGFVYFVETGGAPLGILVRFRDDPSLTDVQRDEALQLLDSLHIDANLAPEATDPPALPRCLQFDGAGTYTNTLGDLFLSLPVPGTPSDPWHGDRDAFALQRASCGDDGQPIIQAGIVDHVHADACHWSGSDAEAKSPADVVAALQAMTGIEATEPVAMTIGGYDVTRIDFSVPKAFDKSACDARPHDRSEVSLWDGTDVPVGGTMRVYVVNAHTRPLVLTVGYDAEQMTPADLAELDQLIGGMGIAY